MLLVSASLKPSPIHGLGCFTNEPIAKGQIVWIYDERVDERVPFDSVADLPAGVQEFLDMYGFAETVDGRKVITLCGDHSKHMNHSTEPNTIGDPAHPGRDIAARDIAAGEELTCNYFEFDLDGEGKLSGA